MELTVSAWNPKVGRDPEEVIGHIEDHPEVDVWMLCEFSQYRKAAARLSTHQLTPMPTDENGRPLPLGGDAPLLIRSELDWRSLPPLRGTIDWPRPRMSGRHPARTGSMAEVMGTRMLSLHLVSVKGSSEGRDRRIAANLELGRLLADLLKDGQPTLIGGDWQTGPIGRDPQLLKERVPALVLHPTGRIDWFASLGLTVGAVKVHGPGGSDHHRVSCVVTLPDPEPRAPERRALVEIIQTSSSNWEAARRIQEYYRERARG